MKISPVVYVFFNRPEVTRRTFSAVRDARPTRLHLIADGPRATKAGEVEKCRATRETVESMIDWPCEVTRDYAATNLGCGKRLATGLTTAFRELGEAIVVEDDVLPRPEFFAFCTEMLATYRDDPKVHAVSGFNPIGRYASRSNHVLSTFYSMWGWASWQRAWKDYSFEMTGWDDSEARDRMRRFLGNDLLFQYHEHNFNSVAREKLDTWDFQWMHTMLKHERYAIAPTSNLVENLGFHADATHTTFEQPFVSGLKTYSLQQYKAGAMDRLHDKVYGEIIMSASRKKIAALRMATRFPATLALLRLGSS
jgi:hypothetical protein